MLRTIGLAIAAAAATVAGVWIATDDFRLSMALTAAWFAIAAAASLASFTAGRSIGVPILAGHLSAAIATR